MTKSKAKYKGGYVLIIITLVMVTAITLALSAVSQSVTDIKISQEEEESARAFNLAEAGLEEALRGLGEGESFNWTDDATGDSYTAHISSSGADGFVSNSPVEQGDVIQSLINKAQSELRIYWQSPALEIIILKNDSGDYDVERRVVYPNGGEDYLMPDGTGFYNDIDFDYYYDLDFRIDDTVEFIRLRPLKADSYIGVEVVDGDNLPEQHYEITAVGETSSGVTRKIEMTRDISASLPSVFDYAVFSGNTIIK